MDEDFIKNYSLLDRYNVSRETCLDFEKFISMIKSENEISKIRFICQCVSRSFQNMGELAKQGDIEREIFKRAKAEFVSINCPENHETSPTYKPQKEDETRLDGKNNK